ncbi:MAG: tripartite tricarboxylate transporter substrate binding protein [Polaromonas sp.]
MNKFLIRSIPALVALTVAPLFAAAQAAWPAKPITLVSPYAPGGTTDVLARLLASKLQAVLGQTVIVENKGGAGGNIGTDYVAKSKPDGYTFLVASSGPLVIAPSLYPKLPYQTNLDFSPIAPLASAAFVIAVNANSGLNSVKDIIAKGKSGNLAFASAGSGTPQHIIGEMFNVQAGTRIQHIPYKGSGPAMNDLVGGQVPMTFENPVPIMPQVKAGKLKVLAVTSAKRSAAFPDIPTVSELGLKGFDAQPWYGLLGPAGMSPAIVDRMNKEVRAILASTDVKARLFALGAEPMNMSPVEFKNYIAADTKKWSAVVKASGATVD